MKTYIEKYCNRIASKKKSTDCRVASVKGQIATCGDFKTLE